MRKKPHIKPGAGASSGGWWAEFNGEIAFGLTPGDAYRKLDDRFERRWNDFVWKFIGGQNENKP